MRESFREAFRFFHSNACGVVGQYAMTAARLARAEHEAWCRDWSCRWEWDEGAKANGCQDKFCAQWRKNDNARHEHEYLGCVLLDKDGNVLGSLGGIMDPSNDYRRVVEAELCAEALHNENETRSMMAL